MTSKQFLLEFIEILRNENAIWKTKSDVYKDRNEKLKGWEKLAAKYKEYDKTATIEMAKKKYHAIRACYRRELQKIRKSEKSGAGTEDLYIPTLWYFEHLDFLRDQEIQLDGITTMDDSIEEEIEKEPIPKKKAFDPSIFLQTAVNHLQKSSQKPKKDEADIYGESWAVTYRKLTADQKIFAKRLIDDTLMHGQLGQLSFFSSIYTGVGNIARTFHPTVTHYDSSNQCTSTPSPQFSHYSTFSTQDIPSPILSQQILSPERIDATPPPILSRSTQRIFVTNRKRSFNNSVISNEAAHTPNSFQKLFDSDEFQ